VSIIAKLSPFDVPSEMDPRIEQSIDWIRSGREKGILVRDIAAEVDLSESRFSHLFSENLRVPVRRYLLWLRLRDALHMMGSVGNLTEAAHTAGFSDSAHLSRSFRSALGIAPSDLVRHSRVTSFLR
jgi:transcriptional regulator GlxA family with amidase domain